MNRVVECVPNFSEGRDRDTIAAITSAMERAGAMVLDVDMGAAANRTVVTIAGTPEAVEAAAFEAIRTASERIDMRAHRGEHPRIGATDVCPFVPVRGVTMADCVAIARRVGERVGRELGIPVYLYAEAATSAARRSLADIRQGEYEGLPAKLKDPAWAPDFGPAEFHARSGATVIGAREFLIAYNINLNTRDRTLASRIAVRLREAGGIARDPSGEPLRDPDGQNLRVPGLLRNLRAVGWVIEEYGIAQVSINVLNYRETPLNLIYEEASRIAASLGVRVTGSEVVGLVPLHALTAVGRAYLERQGLSPGAPESELVHVAIRSLGLSDIRPFTPDEKVIEYRLARGSKTWADRTLREFADQVSLDTPVPGGGSVAAVAGALAAALSAMVANLTVRRRGRRDAGAQWKRLAVEAQDLKDRLLALVHEDSAAFERVLEARRLPADSAERARALADATLHAASVPSEVLRCCERVAELSEEAARSGAEVCVSDAGVAAALCAAAAEGAALNVLINLQDLADEEAASRLRESADRALRNVRVRVSDTIEGVRARLHQP